MKNTIARVVLTIACIFLPLTVAAQSTTDIQAQIQQLKQLLSNLEANLAAQTQGTPSIPLISTFAPTSCISLSHGLYVGMSDATTNGDVSILQRFLRTEGVFMGDVTGYYGRVTLTAVQSWQSVHGPVNSGTPDSTGFGLVGSRTRATIYSYTCAGTNQIITTTQPTYPAARRPCQTSSGPISSESSRTFYATQNGSLSNTCTSLSQIRSCMDGTLSGNPAYMYEICADPVLPQQCSINGIVMANGDSRSFYSQSQVGFGVDCGTYQQQRVCQNGTLSGSANYSLTSCANSSPNQCSVGAATLPHGGSQVFFSKEHLPFGSTCTAASQIRFCANGVLGGDGTYSFTSCDTATTSSCSVDGITVLDGFSHDFFNTTIVAYGNTCTKISRTCSKGIISADSSYSHSTCTVSAPGTCVLDNVTVAHGTSKTFYSSPTVPYGQVCTAVALSRTCTNSTLSGASTYQYGTCTVSPAAACTLDGITIANGASHTFYNASSVAYGQTCTAVTRTCANGVLSGAVSNQYSTCTVGTASSCTIDGQTLPNASSSKFYTSTSVPFGSTCTPTVRTCTNGILSGNTANQYYSCQPQAAVSCVLDGVTVASGGLHTFYFQQNIPSNELCSSYGLSRTCTNGTLSGAVKYQYATCTPSPALTCAIDNTIIQSSSTVPLYSLTSAPAGKLCSAYQQLRTCVNGTLSGATPNAYMYASCVDNNSCSLSGVIVASGASSPFYNATTVPFGSTCTSNTVSLNRTCTNGVLSGSATFQYGSCAVTPPKSCVLDGLTVVHGDTHLFYSARTTTTAAGGCAHISQSRTCSNGTLDGLTKYQYASCAVTQ